MKLAFMNNKNQLAELSREKNIFKKWEEIKLNYKLNSNKIDDLI